MEFYRIDPPKSIRRKALYSLTLRFDIYADISLHFPRLFFSVTLPNLYLTTITSSPEISTECIGNLRRIYKRLFNFVCRNIPNENLTHCIAFLPWFEEMNLCSDQMALKTHAFLSWIHGMMQLGFRLNRGENSEMIIFMSLLTPF